MEVVLGWHSGISHNFWADMEREDYGNSFGELCMFCPRPVFPAGLRNRNFITLWTLTFNPMLKSFVDYSHFPLFTWNIGVLGAVSKVLTPLTVFKLRISHMNFFGNVFFPPFWVLVLAFEGDQSCPTYLKVTRPKNFLVSWSCSKNPKKIFVFRGLTVFLSEPTKWIYEKSLVLPLFPF